MRHFSHWWVGRGVAWFGKSLWQRSTYWARRVSKSWGLERWFLSARPLKINQAPIVEGCFFSVLQAGRTRVGTCGIFQCPKLDMSCVCHSWDFLRSTFTVLNAQTGIDCWFFWFFSFLWALAWMQSTLSWSSQMLAYMQSHFKIQWFEQNRWCA